MNVIEIPEKGKKVVYPSSWEEMSRDELLFTMALAMEMLAGKISQNEFKTRVFYKLAKMHRSPWQRRKELLLTRKEQTRKWENVGRAAETISWMFSKEDDGRLVFRFDCVINPLPRIRVKHKWMIGPGEALLDVSFGEYMVAYDFFRKFSQDRDEHWLNCLCSTLYRPRSASGKREDFDADRCMKREKLFTRLSQVERFIIVSWFAACDHYFKSGDIEVDGRVISLAPLFHKEDGDVKEEEGLGMTGILMAVAESGVFGNTEEVKRTNLYQVLLRLYLWHLENKRLKKIYRHGKVE